MNKYFKSKDFIVSTVVLVISITAYVLFILSMINKNETLLIISSVFVLGCMMFNVINALVIPRKLNILEWIETVSSFVVTIIFVVAYITSIPDESLRLVMTSVVSASIGGIFTLAGVALSIKYNRIANNEEYIKIIKPYIFPISIETWCSIPKEKRTQVIIKVNQDTPSISLSKKKRNLYRFDYIRIGSADLSMCTFCGIVINNTHLIKFDYERIIPKNTCLMILIDYSFIFEEKITSISFLLEDILHNEYLANMRFNIETGENKKLSKITFETVYDIKPSKKKWIFD